MWKRSTITVALGVLLLGLIGPTAAADPSDPFSGKWRSIDVDGSKQKLAFSGEGDHRSVTYVDKLATEACDPDAKFTASGSGVVSGDGSTIDVMFTDVECNRGEVNPLLADGFEVTYTHDSETNTLDDGIVTWHRKQPKKK